MIKKQNGNALFFILIAIALLGLLTMTMTRSSDSTNDTGDFEQNQIAANEILTYAKSLENAVQMLLSRGCSENEISFENSETALNYTNTNSPTDKSCHIFDIAGSGITYQASSKNALDNSFLGSSSYGDFVFSGHVRIIDVETTREEIILYIAYINQGTCESINQTLGLPRTAYIDGFNSTSGYTGSFGSPTTQIGEESTELAGQRSFCGRINATTWYYFAHVLHAR